MLHSWEANGYERTDQRFRGKYCKKPDKPYKDHPNSRQVIKGNIESVGMVRGRQDGIFARNNNMATESETWDGLIPGLPEKIPVEERAEPTSRKAQLNLLDKMKVHSSRGETEELCFEMVVTIALEVASRGFKPDLLMITRAIRLLARLATTA